MLPSPISVVYQCVTNYPELNDIKQQPFYYALRFYGTGIWTEHSRDAIFYSVMFGPSPGKTQMARYWNYMEALHSHAWCLDWDDWSEGWVQLGLFLIEVPYLAFPGYMGIPTAWQPLWSWTSYMWLRTPRVSVPVNKEESCIEVLMCLPD